jgi:signal transduction histidine kinase/CheY-like chemotaxis protein
MEMVDVENTYQVWKIALPVISMAVISLGLLIFEWVRRKSSIGSLFPLVLVSLTAWLILYSSRLLVENVQIVRWISLAEYTVMVLMPLVFLHFALDFFGSKVWRSGMMIVVSLLIPAVLIFAAFANIAPNLLPNHRSLNPLAVSAESKLWITLHYVYTVVCYTAATILLLITLIRNPKFSMGNSVIFAIGVLIPWMGLFSFVFRFSPIFNFDPSPSLFTLSGALIVWTLNTGRSFNVVMTARRSVVDRMFEGLVVLDCDNFVRDINSAAQRIFRLPASDAIDQPSESVFQRFPELLENLRYSSRKNQSIQLTVDQETAYYQLDINPLFDRKGELLGKMLIFHDVTSLKVTEIKLVEAKAHAEQSDNLKSAFLANMSHEIRTPMNVIIGFSNLLNDAEVSNEEREEFIEHIKNSGHSLLQLIDDIIDISKLDAGQIVVENQRFSITRMLAELFAYFNESLVESGKKEVQLLVTGIKDNVEMTILADGVKINRVLRHLLANALKFTNSGFIEFGAKMRSPDVLQFYVQDSGIGIAKEKQGMIFERFSRVMTGSRQEYSGTGMGLAICKGLTELMGGEVWVESNLGTGSTFYVSLPAVQLEEKQSSESILDKYGKAPLSAPSPRKEVPVEAGLISESGEYGDLMPQFNWSSKVLLVLEPDEIGYLNVEMILRQTRVTLVWAKSMFEALNYLDRNNQINAILASAQLNDVSIEDCVGILSGRLPDTPVLAVVPFEDSSLGRACLDLGCRAAIPKPIIPIRLLKALSAFLS